MTTNTDEVDPCEEIQVKVRMTRWERTILTENGGAQKLLRELVRQLVSNDNKLKLDLDAIKKEQRNLIEKEKAINIALELNQKIKDAEAGKTKDKQKQSGKQTQSPDEWMKTFGTQYRILRMFNLLDDFMWKAIQKMNGIMFSDYEWMNNYELTSYIDLQKYQPQVVKLRESKENHTIPEETVTFLITRRGFMRKETVENWANGDWTPK